jgi:hypothetical protein
MTTDELIALYRLLADDRIEPYRLDDVDAQTWLLEAETEAAIRGRLIVDLATIGVTGGQPFCWLPDGFYELSHVAFVDAEGARHPLKLVTSEYLDLEAHKEPSRLIVPRGTGYNQPPNLDNWRDATGHPPLFAVQDDTRLRLVPIPTEAGTLHLEGYRTPLREVDDDPEINAAHHPILAQWVLYRALSTPDVDTMDVQRASAALAEFTRYFGEKPDADLRRSTRHDTPHHVEAFFV